MIWFHAPRSRKVTLKLETRFDFTIVYFSSMQQLRESIERKPEPPVAILIYPESDLQSWLSTVDSEALGQIGRFAPSYILSNEFNTESLERLFYLGFKVLEESPQSLRILAAEFNIQKEKSSSDLKRLGISVSEKQNRVIRSNRGVPIKLTNKEFQIFEELYSSRNNELSRTSLVSRVWGQTRVSKKTLDVHVGNLKKKLFNIDVTIRLNERQKFVLEPKPQED